MGKSHFVLSKVNRNIRGRSHFQSFSASNAVTFLLFHCNFFAPQRQHYISFPSCQMLLHFIMSKQGVPLHLSTTTSCSVILIFSVFLKTINKKGRYPLFWRRENDEGQGGRKGDFAFSVPRLRVLSLSPRNIRLSCPPKDTLS